MAQAKTIRSAAQNKAAKSKAAGQKEQRPTLGFGVPATSDPHHFKITIPRGNKGRVQVSEYLGMRAAVEEQEVIDRVLLDRTRWTAIRSEVQRAFNARLNECGLKTSIWKIGDNLVDRLLGKEFCVLAWAVERMEIDKVPIAVRNWLTLRPEERWWLFGITAISTGGIHDGDKGWRLALRHALGDVAQSELLHPQVRHLSRAAETESLEQSELLQPKRDGNNNPTQRLLGGDK